MLCSSLKVGDLGRLIHCAEEFGLENLEDHHRMDCSEEFGKKETGYLSPLQYIYSWQEYIWLK